MPSLLPPVDADLEPEPGEWDDVITNPEPDATDEQAQLDENPEENAVTE